MFTKIKPITILLNQPLITERHAIMASTIDSISSKSESIIYMGLNDELLQNVKDNEEGETIDCDPSDETNLFINESFMPTINTTSARFMPQIRSNNVTPVYMQSSDTRVNLSDVEIIGSNCTDDHIPVGNFEPLLCADGEPSECIDHDDYDADSHYPASNTFTRSAKFSRNLSPPSRASLLASLIITLVILCVTILPLFAPQSSSPKSDDNLDVINSNISTSPDFRCKCICPPLTELSKADVVSNNTAKHENKLDKSKSATSIAQQSVERRLYVGNTAPNQCNCNTIVQPHLVDMLLANPKEFCRKCECRYQSRNTKTIKRDIIFFSIVLLSLSCYMSLQYLLKYLRITKRSLPTRLKWLVHQ